MGAGTLLEVAPVSLAPFVCSPVQLPGRMWGGRESAHPPITTVVLLTESTLMSVSLGLLFF